MQPINIKSDDRIFFSLVSKAAFANPFSQERAELDKEIFGNSANARQYSTASKAADEVAKRIAKFDKNKPAKLQDFKQSDQDLIRYVFLFDVYHQFVDQFDQLITDQISEGDELIPASFAKDALALLAKRGFSDSLSNRYFSVFYQLRRAYHFIDRGLIGKCDSMRKLRMNLWYNIFTHDTRYYEQNLWDKMEDFSTLFLGPTGSGKGAAAAAIGRSGFIPFDAKKLTFTKNFTRTFISVNLSQFPEALLESELFGHCEGAFTGAINSHDGLFKLCGPHGSIFLDEIGELSLQTQIKLLKVLEERHFCPVGSHKKHQFHGRVIAATNRSIAELRQKGMFRDDFYYRLCSDTIVIPSLQERIQENPQELDDLIAYTVERIVGHESEELIHAAKDIIDKNLGKDYHWPGNVRELAQCIRRVIIKRHYTGDHETESQSVSSKFIADINSGKLNAQETLAAYCTILYQKHKTYEQVSRITQLDRRTVKKYIQSYSHENKR